MIEKLRQLYAQMFGAATVADLAKHELEQAQRELLKHTSATEYHRHMAAFYSETIRRLTKVRA